MSNIMRCKLLILISFIFLFSFNMNAQTNANLEAGISLGFASFQTDFGQRGDWDSTFKNRGLAVGAVLYLNFFNRDPIISGPVGWGQQHLKLKGEISYLQANLEHYGRYIEDSSPQDIAKLKSMTGKSTVINFGTILEYHPFPIPDFIPGSNRKISPYFGLGVMAGFSNPTIETSTGDWETNPSLLIDAYQAEGAVDDSSSLALSLMFSGGIRFKLDDNDALMLDMRWQYFASDLIDGLNPDTELVPNNNDDWLYYLNLGYIHKFGPDSKISTWFKRRKS